MPRSSIWSYPPNSVVVVDKRDVAYIDNPASQDWRGGTCASCSFFSVETSDENSKRNDSIELRKGPPKEEYICTFLFPIVVRGLSLGSRCPFYRKRVDEFKDDTINGGMHV